MHSRFLTHVDPFPSAYLMVDIFFAMSGYVIAMSYGERLERGGYFGTFLEKRAARLLPMWIIGLGIGVLFDALFHHHWSHLIAPLLSLAFGAMFIPVPVGPDLFPYNSPGWSLFYEALANVVFGAAARRFSTPIMAAILLLGAVFLILGIAHVGAADGGRSWTTAPLGLARVTFAFTVGLFVHRFRSTLAGRSWHPAFFWAAMALLVGAAFAAPAPAWRPVYDTLFVLVGCPLILLIGLNSSVGSRRLAEELGTLSYPLYAVHFALMLVVFYVHGALRHWQVQVVPVPLGIVVTLSIIAFAYLLGRHVDGPAQRLANRLISRRAERITPALVRATAEA